MSPRPETLILCLGNDLRADDGVGWKVAERLEAAPPPGAVVRKSALSGVYLVDELIEFHRVIVVDAVQTRTHAPGDVFLLPMEGIEGTPGASPHGIGLPTVLRVGREYGLPLPARVDVVAIEVIDLETLGCGLTAPVEAAVPRAEALVHAILAAPPHPPEPAQ